MSRYRPNDIASDNSHRYRRRDDGFQLSNQSFNGNNMVDERGRRRGRMSNSLPPRDPAFSSYPRRRRSRDRSNDTLSAKAKHIRARRDGFIGSPSYEPVIPHGPQQRPGYRGRPFNPDRPRRFENSRAPFQQHAGGQIQRRNQSLTPFSERSEEQQEARTGGGSPSRQRRARRSHTPLPNRKRLRLLSDSKLKRDDEDHLEYGNGDIILGRYQLLRTLGKGTFGKVAEMVDVNDRKEQKFALKIIRDVDKYRRAAEAEINFLEFIGKCRPQPGKALCVIMHSYFNYHGHMCIVFEKLGISVYDFMKRNDYHPYSMTQTRHIGYQLCHAVRFLHNNRITHTDLKPENMLFTYTDYVKDRAWAPQYEGKEIRVMSHSNIRIIDFGSAIFDQEPHTSTVTTRHYRAPEVVMKLGWSKPCDTHEDREHLAMMEHILGRIPSRLIKRSKTEHFSPTTGELDWDPQCSGARYIDEHCKSLESYFKVPYNGDPQEARQLYELLRLMFEYDQDKRIDLDHAVRHEFFDRLPRDQRIPLAFGSEQPSRYNTTMRGLHKERNGDSGFRSLSKDNNNNSHRYESNGRRDERMPSPAASFRSRRQRTPLVSVPDHQMLRNRARRTPPPRSDFGGDGGGMRESNLTQRSNYYGDDDKQRERYHNSNSSVHTSVASSSRHAPRGMHQLPVSSRHNNNDSEQMLFNLSQSERRGSGGSSRYGGAPSGAGRRPYKEQLPLLRNGRPISPRRPPDLIGTPLHITKARARELEQQRQHELGLRFNPPVVDRQRIPANNNSNSGGRRHAAVSPPPPFRSSEHDAPPPARPASQSGEKQQRRRSPQRGDTTGASSSVAASETGAPLVNRYGEVIEYVGDQRRKKPPPDEEPVVNMNESSVGFAPEDDRRSRRRNDDFDSSELKPRESMRMLVTNDHLPSRRENDIPSGRDFDNRMEPQTSSSSSRRVNEFDDDKRQPPRRLRRNDSDPGNQQQRNRNRNDNIANNSFSGTGDDVFKPPPVALTRRVQQIAAEAAGRDSSENGGGPPRRSKLHRAGRKVQAKKAKVAATQPPTHHSSSSGEVMHGDARATLDHHRSSGATKRERSPQNDDDEHGVSERHRAGAVADNDDGRLRDAGSRRHYAENDNNHYDSSPAPEIRLSSQVFVRKSEDNNLDYDDDDGDNEEDNANKYIINSNNKHALYEDGDENDDDQGQAMPDDDNDEHLQDEEEMIVGSSPPRATMTTDERRQRMYKRLR